ncbi:MAG: leucine-rich repeat domain-containing protein [Alistipes sp.]|nr:leucine-rich repeat domain-containing protein [Alistipes sp.]
MAIYEVKNGEGIIPEGTTVIERGAFKGCEELKSLIIPEGVTSIGDYAFEGCKNLESITIPASVKKIACAWNAFKDCTALKSIVVAEGNLHYSSRGCNAIINIAWNELVAACSTTVIPDGVRRIASGVFTHRDWLKSINIPASVTEFGGNNLSNIFGYSPALESIVVAEGNPKYDSRGGCNAIIDTESNTLVFGCATTIIPEDVTKINPSAFVRCKNLTSITIPASVTTIGYYAFKDCTSLTSVTILGDVTEICEQAFHCCSNLTSVTISGSVAVIGKYAFEGCSLTEITLPKGVTKIEANAFASNKLRTVTLPAGIKKIDKFAFAFNDIETIYVPAKKGDYYRQRLEASLHDKIVELEPEKKAAKK